MSEEVQTADELPPQQLAKRRRGCNIPWETVEVFTSRDAGMAFIELSDERNESKGRLNQNSRGEIRYLRCKLHRTGCRWESRVVLEKGEEGRCFLQTSRAFEHDHKDQGPKRGFTTDTKEAIAEAITKGYKKPLEIVNYLKDKDVGMKVPTTSAISNKLAYEKRCNKRASSKPSSGSKKRKKRDTFFQSLVGGGSALSAASAGSLQAPTSTQDTGSYPSPIPLTSTSTAMDSIPAVDHILLQTSQSDSLLGSESSAVSIPSQELQAVPASVAVSVDVAAAIATAEGEASSAAASAQASDAVLMTALETLQAHPSEDAISPAVEPSFSAPPARMVAAAGNDVTAAASIDAAVAIVPDTLTSAAQSAAVVESGSDLPVVDSSVQPVSASAIASSSSSISSAAASASADGSVSATATSTVTDAVLAAPVGTPIASVPMKKRGDRAAATAAAAVLTAAVVSDAADNKGSIESQSQSQAATTSKSGRPVRQRKPNSHD